MKKEQNKSENDFRVDFLLDVTQTYAPYTYRKRPVSWEMADSLGRYLQRQGSKGRIVSFSENKIIREW